LLLKTLEKAKAVGEIILDLGLCISVYGNLAKLSRFLNDETTNMIGKLADLDIITAMNRLEDGKDSSVPSREIEAAIVKLDDAHTKYIDITKSWWVRLQEYIPSIHPTKRYESYRKASDLSILIGICYRLLNEHDLELKHLNEGLSEFKKSVEIELNLLWVAVRDPHGFGTQETLEIREKELEKMRMNIVRLIDTAEKRVL
jgi:hypothetical protein